MRKNLKNKIIALLLIILSVCVFGVACGETETPPVTVTLDKQTVQMEVDGNPVTITATTSDGSVVTWESSNVSVATVENGVVTALSAGSAIITAKSGESSSSCYVTVTDNRPYSLQATVLGVPVSTLNLREGESQTINAFLVRGNSTYNANFQFVSSNPEIASVQNGLVTAIAKGDTEINYSAQFNGQTYNGSVKVHVTTSLMLDLDVHKVNLSTLEGAEYPVSKTSIATVYDGDDLVSNAVIEWESLDDSVATVSNGIISAVSKGNTKVIASCDYACEQVSVEIDVNVYLKQQTVNKEFIFSLNDDASFLIDLGLTLDSDLKEVIFHNDTNTYIANSLDVPKASIEKSGYYTLSVETEKMAYVCKVVVADKIIKTANELARWPYYVRPDNWSRETGGHIYDGVILLGADIDFSELNRETYFNELAVPGITNGYAKHPDTVFEVLDDGSTKIYGDSNGPLSTCLKVKSYSAEFVGVFDGMGHTIYNVETINQQEIGLFGTISSGTIKNLGLVNVTGRNNTYSGLLCKTFSGTAENIFVEGGYNYRLGQDVGLLFSSLTKKAVIKNITGILNYGYGGAVQNPTANKIGVIAGLVTKETTINNVYALGLEAYTYQDVRAYDNLNSFKLDVDDLSDFGLYWNTEKGFPIFQSALEYWKDNAQFELTAINDKGIGVQTAVIGESLNIKVKDRKIEARDGVFYGLGSQLIYNTLTVDTNGVTINGNVLTISNSVPVETLITVTATNVFTGAKTTMQLLTVYESADETVVLSAYDTETNYVIESEVFPGTVTAITFVNSEDGTMISKNSATIAKADLPTGYYQAIVTTTNGGVVINVTVADKVITTAKEFANWPYYIRPSTWSYGAGLSAAKPTATISTNAYDGLIVLGADIDMGGAEYFNELMYNVNGVSVGIKQDGTITNNVEDDVNFPWHPGGYRKFVLQNGYCAEFIGTFDGMGHTVYNFHIDKAYAGIFGFRVGSKGVVKNLGVTQVTLNHKGDVTNSTFKYQTTSLAGYMFGSAYDIFVEGAMNFENVGQSRNSLGFGDIQSKVEVVNLVGVVTYSPSGLPGDYSNCRISVTAYGDVTSGVNVGLASGNTVGTNGSYPQINDRIADFDGKYTGQTKLEFSTLDSKLWDVSSGYPIFKSAIGKLSTLNLEVVNANNQKVTTVNAGETVTIQSVDLSASGVNSQMNYWTFEVDGNAVLDVSDVLNGVKLTVNSGVSSGTQIKVTATNQLDKNQKVTLTLTVN